MSETEREALLRRIADALERLAPQVPAAAGLDGADAFIWHPEGEWLEAVARINRLDLGLLKGIERQRDTLLDNTRRFARDLPANNALLWGARGTGKSSLVKSVHAAVSAEVEGGLRSSRSTARTSPPCPASSACCARRPGASSSIATTSRSIAAIRATNP